jgi:hypothetical protein
MKNKNRKHLQEDVMRYLLGLLVFAIQIIFVMLVATGFDLVWLSNLFFDGMTFAVFLLTITAVIITQGGHKTFIAAINAVLSKKYHIAASDKEKAIRLFRLIGKSVTATALLLTVIGVINILSNLDNPATIGVHMAMALLSIMHGIIINLVFVWPVVSILETRYNTEEKTVISEKQVIDKLLELCYRQGITPEEILDADEIKLRTSGQ